MFTSSNSLHNTDHFSNKLKSLSDSLKDTSTNLKSLDYLLLNPSKSTHYTSELRAQDNNFHFDKSSDDLRETTKSINKIEHSLENISSNQNRLETEMKRLSYANVRHNPDKPWRPASTTHLDRIDDKRDFTIDASISVENRLKEAQKKLRSERISADNRNNTLTKSIDISADLKAALVDQKQSQNQLHQIDKEQMDILTKRVVRAESENSSLKFEFDALKRQFLNESGAKNALLAKLESSKTKIRDLEDEIDALRKHSDLASVESEINRKKADSTAPLQERISMLQWENEQLKQNSNQCSHLTELEELRRHKDKSERRFASVQDQMSETIKQTESKQAHINRLMDELRELQEQISLSKSNFQGLEQRFQENQNELRQRLQVNKEAFNKIERLENTVIELEADRNKGFSIRDDEIERFENQNARLKNDIEKVNIHLQENAALINDLHSDNEILRQQLTAANCQSDALRKEMESLLKARSIQDEILKRRQNDNDIYHSENGDLKAQLEVEERNSEKHKFDVEIYSQELTQARETIAVQEERLTAMSSAYVDQKEELHTLKSEISNQRTVVVKLENQINYLNRQISDYRERDENIDYLKRKLAESQGLQEKMTNDLLNNTRKKDSERTNHVKKLEQLLDAERGASKVLMTKCDRQILEINRLHQEYWNREQLVQEYKKRYNTIKEDMEILLKQETIEKDRLQNKFSEEILEREQELAIVKDKQTDVIVERDQIFRWIIDDIDGVVELLSHIDVMSSQTNQLKSSNYLLTNQSIDLKSCPPSSSALATLGGLDLSKAFIDIKSKVSWIRSEVNLINNHFQSYKDAHLELTEELNVTNERLRILESEKTFSRESELDDARKCISKLKIREKNEANLQLKCDRLQEELHQVRQYLSATLGEHCHHSSYY